MVRTRNYKISKPSLIIPSKPTIGKTSRKGWTGWIEVDDDTIQAMDKKRRANGFDDQFEVRDARARSKPKQAAASISHATKALSSAPVPADSAMDEESEEEKKANSSEEDMDIDGGEDGSSQEDESEGGENSEEKQSKAASTPRLEMLHCRDVDLVDGKASIETEAGLLIDHESAVYQHGGEVVRVNITSADRRVDLMICNESACEECHGDASDGQQSKTLGLPFVHELDCIKRNLHRFWFRPSRYELLMEIPETFGEKIRFQGLHGEVVCEGRVCDAETCTICSAKE